MSAGPAARPARGRQAPPSPPGRCSPAPRGRAGEGRPAALTLPTPAARPPEGAPAGPEPGCGNGAARGPPGRDLGPRRHPRAPRRPPSRRARSAGPRLEAPLFVSVTSGTSRRPSAPVAGLRPGVRASGRPHDLASPRGQPGHRSFHDSARPHPRPRHRTASPATASLPHPSWTGCPPEPPRSLPLSQAVFALLPSDRPTPPILQVCKKVQSARVWPWRGPGGNPVRRPRDRKAPIADPMLPWDVRSDLYPLHPRGLVKVYSSREMDQEGLDPVPRKQGRKGAHGLVGAGSLEDKY